MNEPTEVKPPFDGMTKIPYGLPLMMDAWMGCLMYAIGEEIHRDAFTKETGHDLKCFVGRSGFEALIDKQTGREKVIMGAFCDWVTVHLWGEEGSEGDEEFEEGIINQIQAHADNQTKTPNP